MASESESGPEPELESEPESELELEPEPPEAETDLAEAPATVDGALDAGLLERTLKALTNRAINGMPGLASQQPIAALAK